MSVIEPLRDDSAMQRRQIINTGVNFTYSSNWVKLNFFFAGVQWRRNIKSESAREGVGGRVVSEKYLLKIPSNWPYQKCFWPY